MSINIKEFSTIRILTSNVAGSRDFYKALFNQKPIEDTPGFVSFKIAGVNFDITVADEKNPASSGGSLGYWLVDDLGEVLRRATELGAKLYRGPLEVRETGRTILQIQDPFGCVIGFESAN